MDEHLIKFITTIVALFIISGVYMLLQMLNKKGYTKTWGLLWVMFFLLIMWGITY